jgi:hypothetical protein
MKELQYEAVFGGTVKLYRYRNMTELQYEAVFGRTVKLYRYRNMTELQYEAVFGRKDNKTLSISKHDRATVRSSVRQEGQ